MEKFYTTKEFARVLGIADCTVANWRRSRNGKPPVLPPARYEKRHAVYTEAQLEIARDILNKKSVHVDSSNDVTDTDNSTITSEHFHAPKSGNDSDKIPADIPDISETDSDETTIDNEQPETFSISQSGESVPVSNEAEQSDKASKKNTPADQSETKEKSMNKFRVDSTTCGTETQETFADMKDDSITNVLGDKAEEVTQAVTADTSKAKARGKRFTQRLENAPTEFTSQPRFFPVNENKLPIITGWQKPENQRDYREINGLKGFDTCGHGRAPDYLFLDFDHVLDDAGEFVNDEARRWYNFVQMEFGGYCERSISGHGLHILAKPTPNIFNPINAGSHGTIYFGKHDTPAEKKSCPKMEIFYQSQARYCLLTGIHFDACGNTIAEGSDVDGVFQQLLDEIQKQNQPAKKSKADSPANTSTVTDDRAIMSEILATVKAVDCDYADWRDLGMVARLVGIEFEEFDAWSSKDDSVGSDGKPRYNRSKVEYFWKHYQPDEAERDKLIKIGTAIDIAKKYGYKPPKNRKSRDRIAELSEQPQSKKRDEEIIAAIRDACEWRYSKDENGVLKKSTIKATYSNLQLIFDNDPNLIKLFGTDEFQGADVFLRRPPWRKDNCAGNVWTDRDDAQLRLYLRKNYGELSNRDLIQDFTVAVAQDNSFHPVKEYFRNLPRWDGTPRAEELFIKFLRVDDTPFAREITRKWLLGAIARIFHPGCRFQIALTIQGNQGIGKSYIFERLGGKWYGVLSDNMDDSHAQDAIQNLWIVEIKEFKAARQADINSVKAFIDTSTDNRRAPYERRPAPTPRHCAFGITVNDKQFLSDKTGNRRFPILESKSVAGDYVEGLTDEYISQVWAEVYQHYNELFKDGFDEKKLEKALELSREAKLQVERVAENFMRDDDLANDLRGYLDTLIPAPVLWNLLTKEERRKFIADGKIFVGGGKAELETRIKNRQWKKSAIAEDIAELYRLLASENNGKIYRSYGDNGLIIYGTELRQHICMSEILSEAFANGDKRKNTFRITEILSSLEGWTLGERLQKADPQYPDQRKPYYRNADNLPTNDDDTPTQKDTTKKHEQSATFSQHEEQVKAGNSIEDFADLPIDPLENPPF